MDAPFRHMHDLEEIITTDVTRALAEDLRDGDLTACLIPENARGRARVVAREEGVIAGGAWFERCFTVLDPDCEVFWHVEEGKAVTENTQLCEISGNARALLSAERTALNFLQTMSAIASQTRKYVIAVIGTKAKILDTRKTMPGLRMASKYAVHAGGGTNHRIGLFDGILIKENHIFAAGGIAAALKSAFALAQHQVPIDTIIEIEVETIQQLGQAIDGGARLILLDNMNTTQLREAVKLTNGRAELEASGGVTLQTVRGIAETGVDRISVGALTKDVRALDLSMRFTLH